MARGRQGLVGLAWLAACDVGPAEAPAPAPSFRTLSEQAELWSPEAPDPSFGRAVVLLPDVILVGQPDLDRLFRWNRSGTSLTYAGEIVPAEPSIGFGESLAADAAHLVVGARENNLDEGRLHLFERAGGQFVELDVVAGVEDVLYLGWQVTLSGDTVAIPATGGVRIYDISAGTLAETQVIDVDRDVIALDGDTLVVASYYDDPIPNGAVRIFRREAGQFTLEATLENPTKYANTEFGRTAGVVGDTLLVSMLSPRQLVEYQRQDDGTWELLAEIPYLGNASSFPGHPLAMTDSFAVVGNANSRGYLLARVDGSWTPQMLVPQLVEASFSDSALALGEFPSATVEDDARVILLGDLDGAFKGTTCADGSECLSGLCVDGVCCDQTCDTTCRACSVSAGALVDGECMWLSPRVCCIDSDDCEDGFVCEDEACVPLPVDDGDGGDAAEGADAADAADGGGDGADGVGDAGGDGTGGGIDTNGSTGPTGGCGCRQAPGAVPLWWLLALPIVRRRSRR